MKAQHCSYFGIKELENKGVYKNRFFGSGIKSYINFPISFQAYLKATGLYVEISKSQRFTVDVLEQA